MRILRSNPTDRRRSGVVMVLFALLVFVLLGFAALTVDVGSAFLAQGQMQNAADSAAIEGVRMRNHSFALWHSNQDRRQHASDMVRFTFDDNFDGSSDAMQFTVGPSLLLTGGSSPDNVGAYFQDPLGVSSIDDPRLELNYDNRVCGDMLSGTFLADAAREESVDYVRADFVPGASSDGGDRKSLGFLVRLRRTSQPNALDHVAGVSSASPGVPYTFGLGTSIHRDIRNDYNPRTQGITVRATAIAAASPTLSVSYAPMAAGVAIADPLWPIVPDVPLMGYYGVVFDAEFWRLITSRSVAGWDDPISSLYKLQINETTGELKLVFDPTDEVPDWLALSQNQVVGALAYDGRSLGDKIVKLSLSQFKTGLNAEDQEDAQCRWRALTEAGLYDKRGYVAVYEPVLELNGSFTARVIGYGFARLTFIDLPSPEADRLYFTPGQSNDNGDVDSWCGQQCASAHLTTDAEALDAQVWQRVFERLEALIYDIPTDTSERYDVGHIRRGTLMSATLVR